VIDTTEKIGERFVQQLSADLLALNVMRCNNQQSFSPKQ
jgi:hypothetical protein